MATDKVVKKLEALPDELIEQIPMDQLEKSEPSKLNKCKPGRACEEEDYFEMITTCKLCGKLF